jgi:hypothetical protein
MVSDEVDEFIDIFTEELLNPKIQKETQMVIKNRPEIYREKVEAQEFGMDGIMKTKEGYIQNGRSAPQHSIDAALRRTDERMLRESPLLIERKLEFKGGNLVPDKQAHKRAAEKEKNSLKKKGGQ